MHDNSSGQLSLRQNEKHLVGALRVTVENDAILVTMPGTRYSVTYHKGDDPSLVASDIRYDPDYPSYKLTFRVRAWSAASAKARCLGWIA